MRALGKYDLNTLDLILVKIDALTQRFDQFNVSVVNVVNVFCEIYGATGHTAMNCQIRITSSQGEYKWSKLMPSTTTPNGRRIIRVLALTTLIGRII